MPDARHVQRDVLRLWAFGVASTALVLIFVAQWLSQAPIGPGYFLVINDWTAPVVIQMRPPTAGGRAYRIDPHESGPSLSAYPFGTEIFIFTTECQPLGVSRVERGYRATVIRADGSFFVSDAGDLGTHQAVYADPCPLPPPKNSPSA